jgi:hypothetical protein
MAHVGSVKRRPQASPSATVRVIAGLIAASAGLLKPWQTPRVAAVRLLPHTTASSQELDTEGEERGCNQVPLRPVVPWNKLPTMVHQVPIIMMIRRTPKVVLMQRAPQKCGTAWVCIRDFDSSGASKGGG